MINNEVIIGIMSVPLSKTIKDTKFSSYIPNSYIKWIEMTGANVVPILYNINDTKLYDILKQINGVIFPGGSIDRVSNDNFKKYIKTYKLIFNYAKTQTKNGNYYPLWATCLGFEFMVLMDKHTNEEIFDYFRNNKVIQKLNATHYNVNMNVSKTMDNLEFIFNNFFSEFNYLELKEYDTMKVLYMNHEYGYPLTKEFVDFYNYFDVLLTSKDKNNEEEYVSAIKYKEYPFYGVQFHPEKPPFEWLDEYISHRFQSIHISYKLSTMFHLECVKNKNILKNEKLLIYFYTLYSRDEILDIIEPKHHKNKKYTSLFERSYYFTV